MMKKRQALPAAAAGILMLLLLLFSNQAKSAAIGALQLCGETLIPSLFPFYGAANLLLFGGLPPAGRRTAAVMRQFFGLPGEAAPALILGLLGGYPIGASTAAELYRQGVVTKEEAVRLSSFANNAGPAFIIGATGLAVFQSVKVGLLLYLIHAASAVLSGLLLRGSTQQKTVCRRVIPRTERPLSPVLPRAISASVQSMFIICAYVVFFSVLLAVVKALPFVGALASALSEILPTGNALLSGLAELSCGILALKGAPDMAAMVTASVLLGWGGFCVFFQSAAVLSAAGLPVTQCMKGKLIQALIAGALTCLFGAVFIRSLKHLLLFAGFSLFLWGVIKIGVEKQKTV